jgi:hypothetical protein
MHNLVDCAAGGDPVVRSNNWFEKRDLQFFDPSGGDEIDARAVG